MDFHMAYAAHSTLEIEYQIGRSGDLTAVQPKASGSSLLYQLVNALSLNMIHLSGILRVEEAMVVPMATGMTLALCLLTWKATKPAAKYVIWPRIDQKSCLKCIQLTGLEPLVVENLLVGDELQTDLAKVEELIKQYGDEILCVLSTTSCFAPRSCDKQVFLPHMT